MAAALARLQHPNIVQVYEIGEHDGRPFFALEYVADGSLDKKAAGTPQPAPEAAQHVLALARAVHYAHERGIVHRDLKPQNVLLTDDGTSRGRWQKHGNWLTRLLFLRSTSAPSPVCIRTAWP